MFAGYGGASFALKKAGIPFECVGYSEIDKYAIQCYQQNHKVNGFITHNFGDATKIHPDNLPDFDLLTGGFPCQAFSNAGKGLGEMDTRGTLFNEIIRIAEVKQPKYMLLENVKGLTTKKHKDTFNKICDELTRIGYMLHIKILNSKDYGIPQNRERVWFVCVRKRIDFQWVEKEELKIFLKDILEPEVDEKYYLKPEQIDRLIVNSNHSNSRVYGDNGISPTLNTMQGGHRQPFIAASRGRNPSNPSDRTTGSPTIQRLEPKFDGTSNTITSVQKDNYVCIKNATSKGYQEAYEGDGVNLEHPNSETRRGRVQPQSIGTLQTNDQRGVITENMSIRKLTPTECFRLMGFLDDEINLDGISNSQRYKLAGNGWDINIVSKIFKNMLKES